MTVKIFVFAVFGLILYAVPLPCPFLASDSVKEYSSASPNKVFRALIHAGCLFDVKLMVVSLPEAGRKRASWDLDGVEAMLR